MPGLDRSGRVLNAKFVVQLAGEPKHGAWESTIPMGIMVLLSNGD